MTRTPSVYSVTFLLNSLLYKVIRAVQNNLINNFLTQSTFVLMHKKLYLLFKNGYEFQNREIDDLIMRHLKWRTEIYFGGHFVNWASKHTKMCVRENPALNFIMDSSKNGCWIILFNKKFNKISVRSIVMDSLVYPKTVAENLKHVLCDIHLCTEAVQIFYAAFYFFLINQESQDNNFILFNSK